MDEQREPRRLFSEQEIGALLRRATELQEAAGTTTSTGLTFEELKEIAAETGIDPQHLARAVMEMEQAPPGAGRFHLLGAPLSIRLERVVEGEVPEEDWEEMQAAIQASFGRVGVSGQVGRSLAWTHTSRRRQAQVTVASRKGQTKIRIFSHFPQSALLTFLPALMVAYLTAGVLLGILGNVSLFVAAPLFISLLATAFFIMRFAFARLVRKKEQQAQQLLARLEQIAAGPAREAAPAEAAAPVAAQTARLDPSLLSDEAAPEEAAKQPGPRSKTS